MNVGCGPAEERVLLTGLHAVADIYCECCKTTLGWKYVSNFTVFLPFLLKPNSVRDFWSNFLLLVLRGLFAGSDRAKHSKMQIYRHVENATLTALLK